jgi:prephenate dehydratase
MKVAYAGAPGAFSHEAALALAPGREAVACDSFAAVAAFVLEVRAALGILPLRNSAAGAVPGVEALIRGSRLEIVAEQARPVRMHLLALPGVRLEEIRTAVSHPMALRQCARTLAMLGLATEEAPNTARAAEALNDRTTGVLASEAAAALYGLAIVRRDVHDDPENATTFALVALLPRPDDTLGRLQLAQAPPARLAAGPGDEGGGGGHGQGDRERGSAERRDQP